MTMKINGYSGSPATTVNRNQSDKTVAKTNNQDTTSSGEGVSKSGSTDSVSLTTTAMLDKLKAEVESQPVVNAEKVDRIRQLIAEGSYNPDFVHVADKLIELEKKFTGS